MSAARDRPEVPQPLLRVVGRDAAGPAVSFWLGHGEDPVQGLAARGWAAEQVLAAERGPVVGATPRIDLVYRVHRTRPEPSPAPPAVPTDPGLVVADGESPHLYQRAAAYGVVTSGRGLLLTQLSHLTNAAGRWTLPGGGIDPGESPVEALHREVWEESGQRVEAVRMLDVQTQHWVGRAPSGRLEDFHAVRIVYAGWCRQPTEPVVHDVGGSTAAVRWVPRDEVASYRITRSFAAHLGRWLG